MPFSWGNSKKKTEKKMLYRVSRLAVINPDFRIRYPELAREVEMGNTRVEIRKHVENIMKKKLKYGAVPKPSVIIKRMNRVV